MLSLTGSDLEIQNEPAGQTFVTNRIGCLQATRHDLGFEWTVDLPDGMNSLIEWRQQDIASLEAKRRQVGCIRTA